MHFVKMEGCGNDYIYLDGEKEAISNPQALARKISDRHFGYGGGWHDSYLSVGYGGLQDGDV